MNRADLLAHLVAAGVAGGFFGSAAVVVAGGVGWQGPAALAGLVTGAVAYAVSRRWWGR